MNNATQRRLPFPNDIAISQGGPSEGYCPDVGDDEPPLLFEDTWRAVRRVMRLGRTAVRVVREMLKLGDLLSQTWDQFWLVARYVAELFRAMKPFMPPMPSVLVVLLVFGAWVGLRPEEKASRLDQPHVQPPTPPETARPREPDSPHVADAPRPVAVPQAPSSSPPIIPQRNPVPPVIVVPPVAWPPRIHVPQPEKPKPRIPHRWHPRDGRTCPPPKPGHVRSGCLPWGPVPDTEWKHDNPGWDDDGRPQDALPERRGVPLFGFVLAPLTLFFQGLLGPSGDVATDP